MAQLVVRNIEESVKTRLKQRARRHGTSVEDEVRQILRNATKNEGGAPAKLGSRIAARFSDLGLKAEVKELKGFSVRVADFEQ